MFDSFVMLPPGETPMLVVTTGSLAASIATTAANPASMNSLNLGSSDPEIQALDAKINELPGAKKRA